MRQGWMHPVNPSLLYVTYIYLLSCKRSERKYCDREKSGFFFLMNRLQRRKWCNRHAGIDFLERQEKHIRWDASLPNTNVGRYRNNNGSEKYYFRIFYHLLDVRIINAWLQYKRETSVQIPLPKFREEVAKR